MDSKKLLAIKSRIETGKETVAILKGELKAKYSELKKEYKCNTIVEAQNQIKLLTTKNETLADQIENLTGELKTKYPKLFE